MKDLIKRLKEIDVIYRDPSGKPIELKNAGMSDFYVDIKKAYGYPDALNLICNYLWEQIDPRTTCIAAEGYGGLPVSALLSVKHKLKLTMVRNKPKGHGKGGWFDGHNPTKDDYVSIFDDVLSTGENIKNIADLIRKKTEARVIGSNVVVKRGSGSLDIPLKYLLVPEDLL
jgi:orotate phosphoribosyltransferase